MCLRAYFSKKPVGHCVHQFLPIFLIILDTWVLFGKGQAAIWPHYDYCPPCVPLLCDLAPSEYLGGYSFDLLPDGISAHSLFTPNPEWVNSLGCQGDSLKIGYLKAPRSLRTYSSEGVCFHPHNSDARRVYFTSPEGEVIGLMINLCFWVNWYKIILYSHSFKNARPVANLFYNWCISPL